MDAGEAVAAWSFDEEFVGVPVPPDEARYVVLRDEWLLDRTIPLRRIYEYRLVADESDEV